MLIGTEILTTAQMRAIESATIDSGSVTGLALMERAGAAVAGLIRLRWPRPGRVTVLCGPGNNGGDGFVIARLLHHAGWTLRVLGMDNEPGADAAAMKRQWLEIGPIRPLDMRSHDDGRPGPGISGASQTTQCDILVDALLGTGGSRPLPAAWAAHLAEAAERGTPIVAVDALSGLDLDTGRYRTEVARTRS